MCIVCSTKVPFQKVMTSHTLTEWCVAVTRRKFSHFQWIVSFACAQVLGMDFEKMSLNHKRTDGLIGAGRTLCPTYTHLCSSPQSPVFISSSQTTEIIGRWCSSTMQDETMSLVFVQKMDDKRGVLGLSNVIEDWQHQSGCEIILISILTTPTSALESGKLKSVLGGWN